MRYAVILPNPPSQRAPKRSAKPKKKATMGKTKKKTRKKASTRKKATRKKAPSRKKTSRRKPARKKASRRSSSTTRKASTRRRSSGTKRRRPSKRRSNPSTTRRRAAKRSSSGVKLKSGLKGLLTKETLKNTALGVAGFGAALALPRVATGMGLPAKYTRGWFGVLATAVSAVMAGAATSALGFKKESKPVLAGGLTAAGVRAALLLIPSSQVDKVLPVGELGTARSISTTSAPASSGVSAYLTSDQIRSSEMGAYLLARQIEPARGRVSYEGADFTANAGGEVF